VSIRAALVSALFAAGCASAPGAPALLAVEPSTVPTERASEVTVRGQNLWPEVGANLDRPSRSQVTPYFSLRLDDGTALELLAWESSSALRARVPAGVAPGVHGLTVEDFKGNTAQLSSALTVLPCAVCGEPDGGRDAGPDAGSDGGRDGGLDGGRDAGADGGFDAGALDGGDGGLADGGCTPTVPDLDGDGFGTTAESPAIVCPVPPGRVTVGGDCHDGDPLSFPGAPEVCNGLDDDCDGVVDDGVCPVDAGWRQQASTGGGGSDWLTVSPFGKDQVWIGGRQNDLRLKNRGAFVDRSSGCGNRWTSSWADLKTGTVYLGGGNPGTGHVSSHRLDAGSCDADFQASADVSGMVGFVLDAGVLLASMTVDRVSLRWVPPAMPVSRATNLPSGAFILDLHGQAPDSVLVAGVEPGKSRPNVWSLQADAGWRDEGIDQLAGVPDASVNAVWTAPGGAAWVVGGLGLVLERSGGTWRVLPAPGDGGMTLRSVVGFSPGRVLTCDSRGRVWRFDGTTWVLLYAQPNGNACNDLGALAEDDVWAVGDKGFVVHWPD